MSFKTLIWLGILIIFIYLVFKQIKNAKNEDFENRDN